MDKPLWLRAGLIATFGITIYYLIQAFSYLGHRLDYVAGAQLGFYGWIIAALAVGILIILEW